LTYPQIVGNIVGMARRAADLTAAVELGQCLTVLHERAGSPKFPKMAKDFYKDYGHDISDEQLREMHNGKRNPASVAIEVLVDLTVYYGCSPRELGSVAEERLNWLRTLDVSAWRWITDCAGQLRLSNLLAEVA
jgi:hypothetical protein